MSKIVNNPTVTKDPVANAQRIGNCKRGQWMAKFYKEAQARGIDLEEIMRKAIYETGVESAKKMPVYGKENVTAEDFGDIFYSRGIHNVYEKTCEFASKDEYTVELHYCPLVQAWQDMGLTDEEIGLLCDIAMEGDRGEADTIGVNMKLEKTIGCGDGYCRVTFTTKK